MTARWVQFVEVLSVGFPFCAFKWLSGVIALRTPGFTLLGCLLMSLALIDLLINAVNAAGLLARGASPLGICATEIALRRLRPGRPEWSELGSSLDMAISFALVAAVIGGSLLPRLTHSELNLWSGAVVLNVLGAGFGRLATSLKTVRERREK